MDDFTTAVGMPEPAVGDLRSRIFGAVLSVLGPGSTDGEPHPDVQPVTDEVMAVIGAGASGRRPPKPPSAPPTVGAALRRTLKSLGISQVTLARVTGLSAKHVNQILSGAVDLSPACAVKVEHPPTFVHGQHLSPACAVKVSGATGVPASVWLGIQGARREWEARLIAAANEQDEIGADDRHHGGAL